MSSKESSTISGRTLVALAWTTVVLLLCLLPAGWVPEHRSTTAMFHIPHLDKVVHFGLFGVLGGLWMRTSRVRDLSLGVLVLGLVLAVLTELIQGLPVISRDSDLLDAIADVAGVIAGVALVSTYRVLRGSRAEHQPSP